MELIPVYLVIFLYGIVIGSFLNVCIYRIPKQENIVTEPSHCMNCGYRLKWYDLIPVVSYLMLKGRCRNCHTKLSKQYPLIEAANGVLYLLFAVVKGFTLESLIFGLMASALLVLAVIDYRTYEIPFGINVFLGILGVIHLYLNREEWPLYLVGACSVSLFLEVIALVSKGRAIGGGDIKLMAVAGLLIGGWNILLAFVLACIAGAVIHTIVMRKRGADHVLALGPYLAAGILIAALWGERIIDWYLSLIY